MKEYAYRRAAETERFGPPVKPAAEQSVDLRVENHGSVCLLQPLTAEGRAWVEENVSYESWQVFGGAICVEPRFVRFTTEGAVTDGLVVAYA